MTTTSDARRELPGVVKPRRFRPRFHYELLVCGLRGHELVGLEAGELRPVDRPFAREMDGTRWHRCLRCDSWLPFRAPSHPTRRHPPAIAEIELPPRGRPLRDKIILRLIAVDHAIGAVILAALAIGVLLVANHEADLRDTFYRVLGAIHGGVGGPTDNTGGFVHQIDDVLSLAPGKLRLVGAALVAYAALKAVEAVGLWRQRRWAEYLTLIATCALLPLEVYELAHGVSPLKVIAVVLNLAIALYLLFAKRLFGVRGGVAAEEALRARDMGWTPLAETAPEAHSTRA
ncbi:MAG: DUF2127 domain-containing protein [Solirubrobacterales bacterium]|nr:DUF2127 domain-containing protein [Solirubrobacterales bacterium]